MDKKLTDSEIVKALNEADGMEHIAVYCYDGKSENMTSIPMVDIIDLINRLQAENEELKKELAKPILATKDLKVSFERIYRIGEENALVQALKAEAYKECIEKVYKFICDTQNWGALHREFLENGECYWLKQKLNNLLKELVGETDA